MNRKVSANAKDKRENDRQNQGVLVSDGPAARKKSCDGINHGIEACVNLRPQGRGAVGARQKDDETNRKNDNKESQNGTYD